jgi:hypothetical protein
VLENLDGGRVSTQLVRLGEHLVEQARARGHAFRQIGEHLKKLLVTWNQSKHRSLTVIHAN